MKSLLIAGAVLLASTHAYSQTMQGNLENPVANSTESGIGLVSGWHCTAKKVTVFIDGVDLGESGVGSIRNDTTSICGHANTGFSLLYNYNLLEPGPHLIQVYADGHLLDQREFSTVRSGGVPYLDGASKTVEVQDFPTTGSTATLTWSQAKQSFVVTKTNIIEAPHTSLVGLEKLYGLVTFNYSFSGSSNVFTDSVRFSSNDLNSSGSSLAALTISGRKAVGCTEIDGKRDFICLIAGPSGWFDAFAFNISAGGNISGEYEYCSSTNTCAIGLTLSPDGSVSGLVDRSAATRLATRSILSLQDDALLKFSEKQDTQSIDGTYTSYSDEGVDQLIDLVDHLLLTIQK